MKASISYDEYKKLELIPSAKSSYAKQNNQFGRLWQSFLAYLSGSSELQVWQADSSGIPIWRAYDPVSQRRAEFTNEADLRVWLEERYYQPNCI